jgi:hypothetical protein
LHSYPPDLQQTVDSKTLAKPMLEHLSGRHDLKSAQTGFLSQRQGPVAWMRHLHAGTGPYNPKIVEEKQ